MVIDFVLQSARAHQQLLDQQVSGINSSIADATSSKPSQSNVKGESHARHHAA